jgi:hypothetical protein
LQDRGPPNLNDILAAAAIVVALPTTLLHSLELSSHPAYSAFAPYLQIGGIGLILGGGIWIGFRLLQGSVSRAIASRRAIANYDQHDARKTFPEYSNQIEHHFSLLRLSLKEFARRVNLSRIEAWAMLNNPDIIPRPELIPLIEDALLLPRGYFVRGKALDGLSYGRKLTKARFKWHQERWSSHVFLLQLPDVDRESPQRLAEILHNLETQIEAKLTRRPK